MVVAAPVQSGSQSIFQTRYDNFIGGKWVPPVKGKYSENLSPITGKSICQIPRSSAEDVELALDAAHAAKDKWGKTSPADRARVLNKIADRIEENLDRLAIAETWDNGKPIRETRLADIPLAIDHFRYFASCIRAQEGSIGELDETTVAYHFHEPLGVIGQIIPWNFPILMAAWKLAPALAAGNCVVLKPAGPTPASILVLMEIIADLVPDGVINVINGPGAEIGKTLATSPRIAKVAFTGETTTGRLIMQYASQNVIPVTLELGGKSPNIFFEDICAQDDEFLDKAVEGLVMFAFNQGEVCTCPSRALIQESIYDRFMERAIDRIRQIKQDNPLDPTTALGAQVSINQMEKIAEYVKIGHAEGAECLIGGERKILGRRLARRLLFPANSLQRKQQNANFPRRNLRPSISSHHLQRRSRSIRNCQRYSLRFRCRSLDSRHQHRLPHGSRRSSRPRVDKLLSPLSGPRSIRRLQIIWYRPRKSQNDVRSLPAN
jgi:aldehyde dehydrogenase